MPVSRANFIAPSPTSITCDVFSITFLASETGFWTLPTLATAPASKFRPTMIYDSVSSHFKELNGSGLPLGVFENSVYTQFEQTIRPGQIILIGTDGIWESHNPQGDMFGKARFKDIIKTHADLPAKEIIESVITALDEFSLPLQREDDVTLVIVKVQEF